MIKVVSVEQMREIERATDAAGISYDQMMQQAGAAVADVVKLFLGDDPVSRRITVLVGPGNNGGDGLVTARILKEDTETEVGCYLLKRRSDEDPVYAAARDAGVLIANAEDDQGWSVLQNLVAEADILIDALLGTGARLPVEGDLKMLLEQAGAAMRQEVSAEKNLIWPSVPVAPLKNEPIVIAVDVPSGLNCDTGELDPAAIHADVTVTFAAAKHGQVTFPGAEAVGELVVAGIGTPENLPELNGITLELATGSGVGAMLPPRPRSGHKGTFGRAVVLAGSVNYTGAAALAASSAYRAGAGLVTLAVPQAIYPILASQLAEATWLLLPHEMGVLKTSAVDVFFHEVGKMNALLIGPGLGQDEETLGFMRGLLQGHEQMKRGNIGFVSRAEQSKQEQSERELPERVVIDADGLNLLAKIDEWWKHLPPYTVLTPHPGEMARLIGLDTSDIQENRFNIAREKAAEWNMVVVLKGAFTLVAAPDGRVIIIPFATDALATAGTGDVLAGCITGLLAQGAAPFEAAVAGAYAHGLAGKLAGEEGPSRSVVAGDVLRALPSAFALIE